LRRSPKTIPTATSVTTKTKESSAAPAAGVATDDEWLKDKKIRADLKVSAMTLWRMDRDAKLAALGWPVPIRLGPGGHKHRSKNQYEISKANMLAQALADRGKPKERGTRSLNNVAHGDDQQQQPPEKTSRHEQRGARRNND